jgi:putative hydrolase of the HAD superfamily
MTRPLDPIVAAEAWIFDLDNTLYPARLDLFALIDIKMRTFVADLLKVPHDEARTVQKGLFRTYGTTMGEETNHSGAHEYFLQALAAHVGASTA